MPDHRTASSWVVSGLMLMALAGCGDVAVPTRDKATTPEPSALPGTSTTDVSGDKPEVLKPNPPLAIPPPAPPPKLYEGKDLAEIQGPRLSSLALRLANEKRYPEAVQLQHWSTMADDDGRYNLACFHAMAGNKEAAFYWLQEAAIKDGVDAVWAGQDSDLDSLRRDPRWRQVQPYLEACNRFWGVSGFRKTILLLPEGYKPGTPIGVLVGMHGMGANSEGFVRGLQEFSNELGMAIVGVSGTVPRGPRGFVWSEDVGRDADQIRIALKEVSDRLTVKPGQVVAFGFSQGAQMAFEVAFRYPDEFRGAIVMSPGTTKNVDFKGLVPGPKNRRQGYVCLCGAGEAPGNIAYTRLDHEFAQKAGARVELKLHEGQENHSFPPDFADKFVDWVRFVLGEGKDWQEP